MKRGVAALMVGLLLAVLFTGGCGVPLDDSPRAINRATTTTTTTSTTPENASDEVTVFYVNKNGEQAEKGGLVATQVPVSEEPTVRKALTALFTADVPPEFKTSIPKGTDVISVTETDSLVTVNLTSEIDDVKGDSQKAAYAQMVFTVLAFPEFSSVRFSIEGNSVEAPTDGPNRSEVTVDDYKAPLRPSD